MTKRSDVQKNPIENFAAAFQKAINGAQNPDVWESNELAEYVVNAMLGNRELAEEIMRAAMGIMRQVIEDDMTRRRTWNPTEDLVERLIEFSAKITSTFAMRAGENAHEVTFLDIGGIRDVVRERSGVMN